MCDLCAVFSRKVNSNGCMFCELLTGLQFVNTLNQLAEGECMTLYILNVRTSIYGMYCTM